jgi:uncharacterized oligopeptide transporter (OPT) family protein
MAEDAGDEPERAPGRRPPTPRGLDRMDAGELERYDPEMYANINTGVLEQYLEERNREETVTGSGWDRSRVLVGVLVGALFALVNVYVGLKLGLVVAGAWYVTYILGARDDWGGHALSQAAGAASAASVVVAGFVFVYPALLLLREGTGSALSPLLSGSAVPTLAVLVPAAGLAGILGGLTFVLHRRPWLVEDPLPYPPARGFVRLVDLGRTFSDRARRRVAEGLRYLVGGASVAAIFAAVRDLPLAGDRSVLGAVLEGAGLRMGPAAVGTPPESAHYTMFGVTLSPLIAAVGWFLRLRASLAVAAGTAFTWGLVVPLAVWTNVPVVPPAGPAQGLETLWQAGTASAPLAFSGPALTVAAGVLVGALGTALVRSAPSLGEAASDLAGVPRRWFGSAYEEGRGWYEWPPRHLPVVLVLVAVGVPVLLVADGADPGGAALAGLLVAGATLLLGAAAVRILGATSAQPVTATALALAAVAYLVLRLVGTAPVDALALALVAAAVFGVAAAAAGNALLSFKVALYAGVRPFDQMKAELAGLVPGLALGGLAAVALAQGLASGVLDLAAPQAQAFARLGEIVAGTQARASFALVGVAAGAFAETVTGEGTYFALGTFFPVGYAVPLLLGGAAREWWEARLPEQAQTEEGRTVRLLDGHMAATGLIAGEALVGVLVAAGYALDVL